MRIHVALLATALAAAPLSAQPTDRARTWGFIAGFDGFMSQFEHASETAAGVGSRGWGLSLTGAVTIKGLVVAGADLGGAFVGDDSSFSQSTTGGQKKSSTAAFFASAYAGLKSPAVRLAASPRSLLAMFGANIGTSSWSGKRSIDKCVDCREEDVKFLGGSFVEPYVIVGKRRAEAMGGVKVAFRLYQARDATVKNVLFIGIGRVQGR